MFREELVEENDRAVNEESQQLTSVEKTAEEIDRGLLIEFVFSVPFIL